MTWEELTCGVEACRKCGLCETRLHAVPGEGDRRARLMLVGEAPGKDEDEQGRPFVGRSGKLLDLMLELIGLTREDVYICNVIKCRPPQNRDPNPEERTACRAWLDEQIRLVDPKLVLCLGRISAKSLIDPEFLVTKQHGQWTERDGRLYMGTFHPAALLRDPNKRPEAFGDFKEVERKLRDGV